jgi:hypothetical protein
MSLVDESLGFGAYDPPREVELELGGVVVMGDGNVCELTDRHTV